jgi:heptosyltransferase-3
MDAQRRETVLIFRLGSIGDTVVALPCFHAIARAYSSHRRVLLTNALTSMRASSAESVLDGTGLVDEVVYYPVGDFSIKRVLSLMRELKRIRPATLIYLAARPTAGPVYRDLAFFKAAGVPRVVGLPWNARLRMGEIDSQTQELEHEAQRLARMLNKVVPVNLTPADWDLRLSAAERTKVDGLLDSMQSSALLAIAPGAKIPAKDWGSGNWTSLMKSLASRYSAVGLVMVGARDEGALCEEIGQRWAGPVLNLCGLLTPRETAAALRRCELMVCHDSGPMHLAASQQTRCVALFGNYNRPRKWYPFGSGHRVIYEPRGVREISVQRVVIEVDRAFDEQQTARIREKIAG